MKQFLFAATIALGLVACSSKTEETKTTEEVTTKEIAAEAPAAPGSRDDGPAEPASPTPNVIGLEGLGSLKIGEPVPANSDWRARGAQESDACRTISSPEYPGVTAIVEGGKVRRISAGKGSSITLVEGIGVGASEADVRKWFAGFREEPHKYEDAPAKYLTAPNAKSGDPALRFEIGHDGKVSAIHVGTMPTLGYVEGCS